MRLQGADVVNSGENPVVALVSACYPMIQQIHAQLSRYSSTSHAQINCYSQCCYIQCSCISRK